MIVFIFVAFLLGLSSYTVYVALEAIGLLLKPRRQAVGLTPEQLSFACEDIRLSASESSRLAAWFLAPEPASMKARDAAALIHGYGAHRTNVLRRASSPVRADSFVLLPNSRAHEHAKGLSWGVRAGRKRFLNASSELDSNVQLEARPSNFPDGQLNTSQTLASKAKRPELNYTVTLNGPHKVFKVEDAQQTLTFTELLPG